MSRVLDGARRPGGRVLAISPHLDDAVFSCGATLARWAAEGDEVVLLTVFTASVPDPAGFALACQTDKGLAPDVDYMALRRAEDRRAAAALRIASVVHLDLPEAPHRGYESAHALFAGLHAADDAPDAVAAALTSVLARINPDRVLAPVGLGGHVDHLAVDRALDALGVARLRWIDLPYGLREPEIAADLAVPVRGSLEAKLDACACYETQLGFQFGGEAPMRASLAAHARAEGERTGTDGPAELLLR